MKNYPKSIKSFEDIDAEFRFCLATFYNYQYAGMERELNHKFVLELVASFEAKTVYYFRYIAKRALIHNGNIAESTRKVIRNHQRYLMLTHIGSVFQYTIQPLDNRAYSEFLALVDYRNWIAHGRAWEYEPKWNKFDFQTSLNTISSVLGLIADYPEELKN